MQCTRFSPDMISGAVEFSPVMSVKKKHNDYFWFRPYRFTTYQDARRVRLVDGLETNILRVSPVKLCLVIRITFVQKKQEF